MIKVKNECVGCSIHGLPCIGSSCPYKNAVRYYCDKCKQEEELYEFKEGEYCIDCIVDQLPRIENEESVCEDCGDNVELYNFEGEELCISCIRKRLNRVQE